jgi:hypothetical protein
MPIIAIVVALSVIIAVGTYLIRPAENTPLSPESVATSTATGQNEEPTTTPPTSVVSPEVADTKSTSSESNTPVETTTPDVTTVYADGVHQVTTEYRAPGNARHTVAVAMTLANDVVTAVSITYGGDTVAASKNYQSKFDNALPAQVIGKKLDGIALSRVGGASLTTGAFNNALAQVKTVARN